VDWGFECINTPLIFILNTHHNPPTGNKPLTSLKTNLPIDPAGTALFPNVALRGLVIEYVEARTREWEAAERRWQEWVAEQQGGQGQ
jgi:hypothetical protein